MTRSDCGASWPEDAERCPACGGTGKAYHETAVATATIRPGLEWKHRAADGGRLAEGATVPDRSARTGRLVEKQHAVDRAGGKWMQRVLECTEEGWEDIHTENLPLGLNRVTGLAERGRHRPEDGVCGDVQMAPSSVGLPGTNTFDIGDYGVIYDVSVTFGGAASLTGTATVEKLPKETAE